MLTAAHKETWKTVCSKLLEQYENCGDDFLASIVTGDGDETCLHSFVPETKLQSMERQHANPPYNPDLAPCDYQLLGKLKESLRDTKFEDDDFLMNAAKQMLTCRFRFLLCRYTVPSPKVALGSWKGWILCGKVAFCSSRMYQYVLKISKVWNKNLIKKFFFFLFWLILVQCILKYLLKVFSNIFSTTLIPSDK